jgi:histidine triad (HIT) family protein
VFCKIVAGEAPATVTELWDDAIAIVPRSGGCTDGHVMVVPRAHVTDAGQDPEVTAAVMRRAAELVGRLPAANIITSKGADATQTVFHLHVHIVPRTQGDALTLPWTDLQPYLDKAVADELVRVARDDIPHLGDNDPTAIAEHLTERAARLRG